MTIVVNTAINSSVSPRRDYKGSIGSSQSNWSTWQSNATRVCCHLWKHYWASGPLYPTGETTQTYRPANKWWTYCPEDRQDHSAWG